MDNIIFYTTLDRVIGCTRNNEVKGEPFCDSCSDMCELCSFRWKDKSLVQEKIKNESQLKATFVKLYLEKTINIL